MQSNDQVTALLPRALANHYELFRAMARLSPDGVIEERDGLLLVYSGRSLPLFNYAALMRAPDGAAKQLERARRFFAPLQRPWMISATGAAAAALAPFAQAAGGRPEHEPCMILAPLRGTPPALPALSIRPVQTPADLRAYDETVRAGFGDGGVWVAPEYLEGEAPVFLSLPEITYYLGYLDGQPVATAARLSSHGIAGIFDVSTLPAYRRRGLGSAMTWRAALDGLMQGCIAAALTASEMGAPVYRRMGFREAALMRRWLLPAG